MHDLFVHSLAMLRNPRLIALHLVGNAVLLTAATMWLLIPEAYVWQLLFAAISAVLMILMFLWIHSGTLAYGGDPAPEKFRDAFTPKMGRFVWLAIGFFVLFWCMHTIDGWTENTWQTSGYLYSKAPSFLRPTAGPTVYANYLDYVFSILEWYVIPCLFLPLIVARVIGASSLAGLRTLGRWKYWVGMAVTAVLGVWLTHVIVNWTPGTTLREQTVSLVLRLGVAYVLATAAWLITAGMLGFFVRTASVAKGVPLAGLWDKIFSAGGGNRSVIHKIFAVVSDRRLLVLQLAACVAVAVAVSTDPTVNDATGWRLAAAILEAILLLIGFLWAYSGTLVYATELTPAKFRQAFGFRVGRMAWLLLGVVILLALGYAAESGLWMLNRRDRYVWLISRAISVTSDYLLPSLLLPFAAAKVTGNRLRDGLQALRSWQYWAGMAIIVFLAEWITGQLTPGSFSAGSFWNEIVAVIRLTLADLPLVVGGVAAAGLVSCFVTTRGASPDLGGQSAS